MPTDLAPPAAAAVPAPAPAPADPHPPLGSWSRLYAIVLGALALEIVLLRLLTVLSR